MKFMETALVLLGALSMGHCHPAGGDPPAMTDFEQFFRGFDKDGNGILNLEEAEKFLMEEFEDAGFALADKDNSKGLTPEEFKEMLQPSEYPSDGYGYIDLSNNNEVKEVFNKYDEDSNGEWSLDEFSRWAFGEVDTDNSGNISVKEYLDSAFVKAIKQGIFRGFDKDGNGMLDLEEAEKFLMAEFEDAAFKLADKDNSEGLSSEEFKELLMPIPYPSDGYGYIDLSNENEVVDVLNQYDEDSNGEWSLVEFSRWAFGDVDTDNSGNISVDEYLESPFVKAMKQGVKNGNAKDRK